MLDKSRSDSSSSEEGKLQQPPEYSYVGREECPYGFELDYNHKSLLIGWNFKQMPAKESSTVRHFVILASDREDTSTNEFVRAYYKGSKLGSFMKVVDCFRGTVSRWIERTHIDHLPNFSGDLNTKAFVNVREALAYCLKAAVKQAEYTEITIVALPQTNLQEDFAISCGKLLDKYEYTGHLTLFLPESMRKQLEAQLKAISSAPMLEFYDSMPLLIHRNLKNLFFDIVKLRIRSVEIVLRAINADITITKHSNSLWTTAQEPNTFSRKLTNLNGYTEYIEKLRVASVGVQAVDFHAQFRIVELDGQAVLMDSRFTIRTDQKKNGLAMPPESKAASRTRQTCSGTRQGIDRNVEMHTEQLTIRPMLLQ